MEQGILERIGRDFPKTDQKSVTDLFAGYSRPESDRIRWDILELGKGSAVKVGEYLKAAERDYHDVLYWAEYHKDNPMVRNRDPKRLLHEIMSECGKKE